MPTKKVIKTKAKRVRDKRIPTVVGLLRRMNALKEESNETNRDYEELNRQLTDDYGIGVYKDRASLDSIEVRTRESTSGSHKKVIDGFRAFIRTEFKGTEKNKSILLGKLSELEGEFTGIKIRVPRTYLHEEES